ncbi:Cytochrome P450, family 4, subfamily V, polypeptide 2, partial [Operophtera brumata]
MYVNWILKKRRYPKPPLYPGALPIVGHTLKLLGDNEYMCRLMYSVGDESNKNGGVLLIKVGWDDYYVWRKHRKLLNPAFSQHVINGFLPIFNDMSKMLVENLRKEVGKEPFDHSLRFKAFMDLALALSDKGDLTEKEVWEEMNTIILAGYETTGNTLMYTMLLLGSHANVQNKVFGDSDRDVEKQDLSKLVYLDAVIKETLRLYCITPVMLRTYTLPAGSNCLLFNCSIHRHQTWGADVEEFIPERWLDPAALIDPRAAIHAAFTGFGVGKRLCMGKNYAMMSMKTSLAHVLRHYWVSSDVTQLRLK